MKRVISILTIVGFTLSLSALNVQTTWQYSSTKPRASKTNTGRMCKKLKPAVQKKVSDLQAKAANKLL